MSFKNIEKIGKYKFYFLNMKKCTSPANYEFLLNRYKNLQNPPKFYTETKKKYTSRYK